jgi:acyl-homoserine lactone acylase PvdQ
MFWNELRRKEINMTKEQIEKAAAIYTAQAEESDYAEVRDVKRAFADGANWYINSVWHDASERPKDRTPNASWR